jgi:uncharacterized membrane protein
MGEIEMGWNASSIKTILNILGTFVLTTIAWIFFRAKSISEAIGYIQKMITDFHFDSQYLSNERYNFELLLLVLVFVFVEWFNRSKVEPLSGKASWVKVTLAIMALLALGVYSDYKEFIYFQF